jgi:hypothetical protein
LFENVVIHYVPLRSRAKYALRHGLLFVFEIQKYPFDKTMTLRSTRLPPFGRNGLRAGASRVCGT